jgi:two-component sensor histidine kinase
MTNAVKYGALSNDDGRIEIDWSVVHEGDEKVLQFSWVELQGPTVVAPERKGFGSRLIASSLSGFGTVDVAYLPTGLVLRLSAKMAQVAAALSPVPSETEARHRDHGLV